MIIIVLCGRFFYYMHLLVCVLGPSLVARFRSDLIKKYEHLFDDNRIADYIYHCNAQHPRLVQGSWNRVSSKLEYPGDKPLHVKSHTMNKSYKHKALFRKVYNW